MHTRIHMYTHMLSLLNDVEQTCQSCATLNNLYIGLFIAGLGFYELLDIPQGDRRRYHDDVTVMVISLEGRIWKSSGNM